MFSCRESCVEHTVICNDGSGLPDSRMGDLTYNKNRIETGRGSVKNQTMAESDGDTAESMGGIPCLLDVAMAIQDDERKQEKTAKITKDAEQSVTPAMSFSDVLGVEALLCCKDGPSRDKKISEERIKSLEASRKGKKIWSESYERLHQEFISKSGNKKYEKPYIKCVSDPKGTQVMTLFIFLGVCEMNDEIEIFKTDDVDKFFYGFMGFRIKNSMKFKESHSKIFGCFEKKSWNQTFRSVLGMNPYYLDKKISWNYIFEDSVFFIHKNYDFSSNIIPISQNKERKQIHVSNTSTQKKIGGEHDCSQNVRGNALCISVLQPGSIYIPVAYGGSASMAASRSGSSYIPTLKRMLVAERPPVSPEERPAKTQRNEEEVIGGDAKFRSELGDAEIAVLKKYLRDEGCNISDHLMEGFKKDPHYLKMYLGMKIKGDQLFYFKHQKEVVDCFEEYCKSRTSVDGT